MSDGAIIHDGEKQLVLSRCLTCGQPRLLELRGDGTCAHDTGCGCVRAFTTYAAASHASAPIPYWRISAKALVRELDEALKAEGRAIGGGGQHHNGPRRIKVELDVGRAKCLLDWLTAKLEEASHV